MGGLLDAPLRVSFPLRITGNAERSNHAADETAPRVEPDPQEELIDAVGPQEPLQGDIDDSGSDHRRVGGWAGAGSDAIAATCVGGRWVYGKIA